MKRIKVLFIATYTGMEIIAKSLARERDDMEVKVICGALMDGVRAAHAEMNDTYDIIISRGGTTELLRQTFQIPVVDIEFSAIDMIRMIKTPDYALVKKAIVGSKSIASVAGMICELLNQDICIKTLSSDENPEDILSELHKQGFNYVIGDVCVNEAAEKLGIDSALWTSGTDSVRKAMDEAAMIGRMLKRIRRYSNVCRQLLTQSHSHLYVEDGKHEVLFNNLHYREERFIQQFRKIDIAQDAYIHIQGSNDSWNVLRHQLAEEDDAICFYKFSRHSEQDELPVVINYFCFQTANEVYLRTMENGWGTAGTKWDPAEKKLAESIETIGKTLLPVLINGERGVGKTGLAYAMHRQSAKRNAPFLFVDCKRLTPQEFSKNFEGLHAMEQNKNGVTLYLHHIDEMPLDTQARLCHFLRANTLNSRYRIIASSERNLREMAENKTFHGQLINEVAETELYVRPLRERTEALEIMTGFLIRQYNEEYGRHVVGFDASAIAALKQYAWPGNIQQLCHVILQLVLQCDGFYISREHFFECISGEDDKYACKPTSPVMLNLKQPLDNIIHDIIQYIVEEENGNQSRAAKRLGVSRSTIWRTLTK